MKSPLIHLTTKQKRFVEEYLKDLNATQAAIRAGHSARSAKQYADTMLSKPHIAAAVGWALLPSWLKSIGWA